MFVLLVSGCRPAPPATPLTEAAEKGNLRLVQQHIAAKSDLNAKDRVGLTATHHAAIRGDLPMAQALVAAGADLAVRNATDRTPAELARVNGRIPVAEFLEQAQSRSRSGGRGLVDGGLGVSGVLDSH